VRPFAPFEVSRRSGGFERIERLLRPGRYDIGVYDYSGGGRARITIDME
jgi:hypothetical protein